MESRRLFVALAAALAAYLIYTIVYQRLAPPPPRVEPPSQVTTQPTGEPAAAPATAGGQPPTGPSPATTQAGLAGDFSFTAAAEVETFTLGGGPDDKLQVELTSRGAAVERIKLAEQKDGKYVHRRDAETDEPYVLLEPVEDPGGSGVYTSFLTPRIRLGDSAWELDELVWDGETTDGGVAFTTTLRSDAAERLRVTKTFTLEPESAVVHLRLKVENLGDQPLELRLDQNGPVGVVKEHLQYEMRRLICARWDEQEVTIDASSRKDLIGGAKLGSSEEHFRWTALGNKYFVVYTRPLPLPPAAVADYVYTVAGSVAIADLRAADDPGDYVATIVTMPAKVPPGGGTEYVFEVYAGTKNARDLEQANPAYADRRKLGYIAAADADQRCCCTFAGLTQFMTWLLETIQAVVRNYGIAIIVLVLIIRVLLHPLAVFQQKSMYRMQEAQARLKPKLDAIKEKYPNDKTKVNQETMKLYGEEGVNPMASMVGMLPLMLQMPILIALWTALNTDVHLRHAGFDPWWITDLSAPDRFVEFGGDGITIPILSWLPLIGSWFANIPSLNLLPVLMGISMWLQQKYMPKPGMDAKREAAKKAAAEKKPRPKSRGGMSPEDQLRQQQMISYMMSIMFPLMFYYWPSGLNLYWMATNVFGILESLRIRGQIKADKERREREGPQLPANKKTGLMGRIFKHLAAQAEGLQKKADTLSQDEARTKAAKKKRGQGGR